MPDEHAKLSPSGSARWISCPASIRMTEGMDSHSDSEFAAEGTLAHSVGEAKLRHLLGERSEEELVDLLQSAAAQCLEHGWDWAEMDRHTDNYVRLVEERRALYPSTAVLVEQRVQTGLPMCWGTADAVLVSAEHVEIIDLKYGQGILVSAYENPQTMLYGVGALETFADLLGAPKVVRCTIFQPRRAEEASTFEIKPADLLAWRDSLLPVAEEALHDPESRFGPSDKACRYCLIAATCRPRMEWVLAEAFQDKPDTLTVEEIGDILTRVPEIQRWCSAIQEHALALAYGQGTSVPGWKAVRSAGRRKVVNEALALQRSIDHGYNAEQVATFRIKPLGELEKLMGKAGLADLLGDCIKKSEGSVVLAPESDPREPVSPEAEARKVFTEL